MFSFSIREGISGLSSRADGYVFFIRAGNSWQLLGSFGIVSSLKRGALSERIKAKLV